MLSDYEKSYIFIMGFNIAINDKGMKSGSIAYHYLLLAISSTDLIAHGHSHNYKSSFSL